MKRIKIFFMSFVLLMGSESSMAQFCGIHNNGFLIPNAGNCRALDGGMDWYNCWNWTGVGMTLWVPNYVGGEFSSFTSSPPSGSGCNFSCTDSQLYPVGMNCAQCGNSTELGECQNGVIVPLGVCMCDNAYPGCGGPMC
ncbi:MAG: hypothetical protein JNL01_13235 [Bdellovibrionales bacterium]|nr:hypothetical protein [Bdellovibrionales bacterium]